LRLMRLSRLTRLMRSIPGLLTMVNGMRLACWSVGSSILLVVVLVYVFGIAIFMFVRDEPELRKTYHDLTRTMWILLMDGTFMDATGPTLTKLLDADSFNSLMSLFLFGLFILLSALTVMNLLIGVICEVVSEVSNLERDEKHSRVLKDTILVELLKFDHDGNRMISQKELTQVMSDPFTHRVLKHIDVDVGYLAAVQPMLLPYPDSEASIESIMDLILTCRGSLPVTVKHLVNSQTFMGWNMTNTMRRSTDRIEKTLKSVQFSLMAQQANHQREISQYEGGSRTGSRPDPFSPKAISHSPEDYTPVLI